MHESTQFHLILTEALAFTHNYGQIITLYWCSILYRCSLKLILCAQLLYLLSGWWTSLWIANLWTAGVRASTHILGSLLWLNNPTGLVVRTHINGVFIQIHMERESYCYSTVWCICKAWMSSTINILCGYVSQSKSKWSTIVGVFVYIHVRILFHLMYLQCLHE